MIRTSHLCFHTYIPQIWMIWKSLDLIITHVKQYHKRNGLRRTKWFRLLHFMDLTRNVWLIFFFFLQYWDLNSGPMPWATPPAFFCDMFFWDRVLWTICPGWLQTAILLISASWVTRITGMRCWCLVLTDFLSYSVHAILLSYWKEIFCSYRGCFSK
jgi:hypothetical protein